MGINPAVARTVELLANKMSRTNRERTENKNKIIIY